MECSTTGRASVMVEEGSSGLEGILCCTCASGFTVLKVPVVGEKMTGGSAAGEVCVIDCCRGAGWSWIFALCPVSDDEIPLASASGSVSCTSSITGALSCFLFCTVSDKLASCT